MEIDPGDIINALLDGEGADCSRNDVFYRAVVDHINYRAVSADEAIAFLVEGFRAVCNDRERLARELTEHHMRHPVPIMLPAADFARAMRNLDPKSGNA